MTKTAQPIVDLEGNEVNDSGQPYRDGMVFRCNFDGSQFETMAWNFRNNYEVCVDSFGTMWQSDNDDDGNRGVRINYVMQHGNYGYTDELTGAGWNNPYLGQPADTPLAPLASERSGRRAQLAANRGRRSVRHHGERRRSAAEGVSRSDNPRRRRTEHRPRLSGRKGWGRLQGRDRRHRQRCPQSLVPAGRCVYRSRRLVIRVRLVRSGRRRTCPGRYRTRADFPRLPPKGASTSCRSSISRRSTARSRP